MLTEVILDGPMGKKFGKKWNLSVNSPAEALRIIEINRPGLRLWINNNLTKFGKYRVLCEYEEGKKEELSDDLFCSEIERKYKSIRFTPVVEGAGNVGRILVGAVLISMSWSNGGVTAGIGYQMMFNMGASLVLGGVVGLLSPQPKKNTQAAGDDKSSFYFNGAINTTEQGVPVPLIYGRILTGSHAISAKLDIDDILI